jgi:lysyl endopeptidase
MSVRKLVLVISLTTALLTMFVDNGVAQPPVGFDPQFYASIPAVVMKVSNNDPGKQTGQFVGYYLRSSLNPGNSGYWKEFKNVAVWHLKIRSPDALGVALVLSNVDLNPGQRLFIYNSHEIKHLFTRRDIPSSGVLPVSFVQGEEIVLELQVPINTESGTFNIERVVHAVQDIFPDAKSHARDAADECYTCITGDSIDLAKRSVVKIITFQEGGPVLCTGTLVNNSSEDQSPYVLTAQHCITNNTDANRSIFVFDYDDRCEKIQANDLRQIYGATLLLSSFENDVTLIKLNQSPPVSFRPYFAGWNISSETPHAASSIHHPRGGSKRVSTSLSGIVSANYDDGIRAGHGFWKVTKWNTGITETGSSGAPLFNDRYEIIGTLTGGRATCEYPFDDYFENLSATASVIPELEEWLDPTSSRAKSTRGLDPLDNSQLYCHPITNVSANEAIGLESYTEGEGYFSGHNSAGIASYSERFTIPDSATISAVSFTVGSGTGNGGVVIAIHLPDPNGLPGVPIYETFVPAQTFFGRGSATINSPVKVKGTFFVSFNLSDNAEEAFAINQVMWSDRMRINTAYAKLESGWTPMTQISPHGESTSFDLTVDLCVLSSIPVEDEPTISVYPNPASTHTIVKNVDSSKDFTLLLLDLQGRQKKVSFQEISNNVIVDLDAIPAGMYILKVITAKKVFASRIVKTD